MSRSSFKPGLGTGLSVIAMGMLALFSALGNQGCSNHTPSAAAFVATSTPTLPSNVIDNLEDGDVYLNPTMCGTASSGVPEGFWVASSWGDPSNVVNSPIVFCGGVGADQTSCAIHLYGKVKDNADTSYPSFQLEGRLKGGDYFDASSFGYTGVRFFIKIGTGDNCPYRRFNVPIALTTPPSGGGTCSGSCFGHFGSSVATGGAVDTRTGLGTGVWCQQTYPFSALSAVYGPAQGKSLAGAYLKELLEVEWQFGRNGSLGTSTVDYWIDQIEFF